VFSIGLSLVVQDAEWQSMIDELKSGVSSIMIKGDQLASKPGMESFCAELGRNSTLASLSI